MDLFIIRHGQSGNNALPDIRDREVDPPLTNLGERQAELLAEHLASGESHDLITADAGNTRYETRQGFGITSLFTSPMYRSLQTVQPISRSLGLEPKIWVDIHEEGGMYLNHGGDEGRVGYPGRSRSEILSEFPNYHLPTSFNDAGWWNKDHEDPSSLLIRATKVAEQLHDIASNEDRVAIITHGGFMNALLKALFGQISQEQTYYRHHNTAISRISMDASEAAEVGYLNRIDHLSADLVS